MKSTILIKYDAIKNKIVIKQGKKFFIYNGNIAKAIYLEVNSVIQAKNTIFKEFRQN